MQVKVGSKVIMEISILDLKCLKNDLLDVEGHFVEIVEGLINHSKETLIRQWFQKLIKDPDVDSFPGNEEDLLNFIFSHPDYKDRVARDEEEKIAREGEVKKA